MQPVENSLPQAGCIQAAFVRYQHRLALTLVLAFLRMCKSASVLRTRPPVDEQGEEVGQSDGAVLVEIPQTNAVVVLRARVVGEAEFHDEGATNSMLPRAF